ncbi:hypothetical protein MTBPR1_90016 [Candidatus Terasakiella magnetica]|uniref:Uncharacterized protein n=1 Tax=Candidatus Terasakiella magnetica TaxID=1867952 RepID=A0A1C3RLZ2_9PROT|nr:hypothetical protein [Candidatus Terasakiella magnetica]SCA58169.1 hypothetical protein MTBPR1_90016 [Candidatus Terasakiella magnetica]
MKLYHDENGDPRASADGELAILADFLESDVQDDKEAAIELLQFLERKRGERTANAYTVVFDEKFVTITALEGEAQSQQISRNIFFQAVEAWIVFVGD